MYTIYSTPALVLNVRPHGDNDMILTLLTKEFGLLRAVANGLRKEKSKLRFSLQLLSVVDVSLVKGKSIWRITNAKHSESLISDKRLNLLEKIRLTINRLVQGEEVGDLYNIVTKGVLSPSEDFEAIETIIVLRILNNLGYIEGVGIEEFFKTLDITEELIEKSIEKRKEIIKVINKGFRSADM